MQKKIVKVSPMGMGHLMLEFEDGAKQSVHRGDHERTGRCLCVWHMAFVALQGELSWLLSSNL